MRAQHPQSTTQVNDTFSVQMKTFKRCSTRRCPTNNRLKIIYPRKVLFPLM